MKHRSPPTTRDPKKPLAANIGFRAPRELRDRLLELSNATGWSCNHIAISLVQSGLDQIMYPEKPEHKAVVMARSLYEALKKQK